jgi:hypothetical protein
MDQNRLAMQQKKSDTGLAAEFYLAFSPLRDARNFPGTAPDEVAHDEDAEVLPSLEALIQAVLNSNTRDRRCGAIGLRSARSANLHR